MYQQYMYAFAKVNFAATLYILKTLLRNAKH